MIENVELADYLADAIRRKTGKAGKVTWSSIDTTPPDAPKFYVANEITVRVGHDIVWNLKTPPEPPGARRAFGPLEALEKWAGVTGDDLAAVTSPRQEKAMTENSRPGIIDDLDYTDELPPIMMRWLQDNERIPEEQIATQIDAPPATR